MRRIIGPVLGVLGILLIFGLVAGIAYSAGLAAAGVVVAPGATTTVVPVVGYAWYGGPWFGFGQFLVFLFVDRPDRRAAPGRVRRRPSVGRSRLGLRTRLRSWPARLGPRSRRPRSRRRRDSLGRTHGPA